MEVIIIHRTIIPLTMAIVALIGGEDGTSRRLFPSLFLLLSLLLLLLLYTQIQLYVRKIHDIITSDTTSTCFVRVVHTRKVQTVYV